jgi:hypothetical protein
MYNAANKPLLMLQDTYNIIRTKRGRGFTLVELMVSSSIAMFVFLCTWAIYTMGWVWWYEIAPQAECQRIARVAISVISEGITDSTIGTDTIAFVTYGRRRGVGGATRSSGTEVSPAFADAGTNPNTWHRMNFKLEGDPPGPNTRSFYLGQDANGVKAVYYQVNNASQQILATRGRDSVNGLEDLTFEQVAPNLIKITATASQTSRGVKRSATYTETIYLRNI